MPHALPLTPHTVASHGTPGCLLVSWVLMRSLSAPGEQVVSFVLCGSWIPGAGGAGSQIEGAEGSLLCASEKGAGEP